MTEMTHDNGRNRRIAAMLGWRIEPVQERGFTDFVEVWSPDGKKRGLSDNGRWSEWIHQSYLDRVLPDYEGDLNAVRSALHGYVRDDSYMLAIGVDRDPNTGLLTDHAIIRLHEPGRYATFEAWGERAAAAALEALLTAQGVRGE